jgi:uncharacterized protein YkwD
LRRLPAALLAGFLIALAALVPVAGAAASPQQDAIDQLNEVRQANGLSPLRASAARQRSTMHYARRMLDTDYFGHASRIAVGSRFARAGETLALSSGWTARPEQTVAQWMSSTTHRSVLLSRTYGWIGMAMARGRLGSRLVTVWVAHVGATR